MTKEIRAMTLAILVAVEAEEGDAGHVEDNDTVDAANLLVVSSILKLLMFMMLMCFKYLHFSLSYKDFSRAM